jgi:integrase
MQGDIMASILKQQYTMINKITGERIKKKSAYWYIDYKGADGIRKRVKGFKDKTATAQLAARLEKEAELEDSGIVDKYKEHRKRPLAEHLEDFQKSLLAKGGTVKNAAQVKTRVERIFKECKFIFWDDIQASKVQQIVSGFQIQVLTVKKEVIGGQTIKKKELKNIGKISAQTYNFYLKAIKQFCKWMVQDGRASESPVQHLQTKNVKTDRRHDRRPLEAEQIRALLEATKGAPKRFGMTGMQRAMLYRLAVETGLRASELRSLKVSSFDFNNRSIKIEAVSSKNRTESILPLKKDTAEEFKRFLSGKMPNVKVFKMPEKTAKMFKADLEMIGIPYIDDSGRYCDFHSLRHSTGSLLAASGVHPKIAQVLMRHSDIKLTMNRYTHTLIGQESDAVESLPDLSLPSQESQRMTGTDNLAPEALTNQLTKKSCFVSNCLSVNGNNEDAEKVHHNKSIGDGKCLQVGELGSKKESLAVVAIDSNKSAPEGIRTSDLRFRKPMLYPAELRARLF